MSVGDCERGIVTAQNFMAARQIWAEASVTDVLISGGCYQDVFIKKNRR